MFFKACRKTFVAMTYFKYLVVFCLLCSFVLFYFFAFLKKNMMDITDNICMADFVEAAGGHTTTIFFVPTAALLSTIFSEKTVTLQMPIFALDLEIHWLSEIV